MSRLACSSVVVVVFLLVAVRVARAQDAAVQPSSPPGIYPLLFHGSMGLGAAGGEGRWGIAFERHPGVGEGERRGGLGVGYGGAAGFALIGGSMDGTEPGARPSAGGWIAPVLRPGYYFGVRREAFASGCFCLGLVPTTDILNDGSVRLTLSGQPGFLMNVERFAFGLSMNVGGAPLAAGPRDERGFAIGVVTHLGAAL